VPSGRPGASPRCPAASPHSKRWRSDGRRAVANMAIRQAVATCSGDDHRLGTIGSARTRRRSPMACPISLTPDGVVYWTGGASTGCCNPICTFSWAAPSL
jgi:hypothetical protein